MRAMGAELKVELKKVKDPTCGNKDGAISVEVSGGDPASPGVYKVYLFTISGIDDDAETKKSATGESGVHTFEQLGGGEYYVVARVEKSGEREKSEKLVLVAGSTLKLEVIGLKDEDCDGRGKLEVKIEGGSGSGYKYEITPPSSPKTPIGSTGEVDVTSAYRGQKKKLVVYDSNGCNTSVELKDEYLPKKPFSVSLKGVEPPACPINSDDELTGENLRKAKISFGIEGGDGDDFKYEILPGGESGTFKRPAVGNQVEILVAAKAGVDYTVKVSDGRCERKLDIIKVAPSTLEFAGEAKPAGGKWCVPGDGATVLYELKIENSSRTSKGIELWVLPDPLPSPVELTGTPVARMEKPIIPPGEWTANVPVKTGKWWLFAKTEEGCVYKEPKLVELSKSFKFDVRDTLMACHDSKIVLGPKDMIAEDGKPLDISGVNLTYFLIQNDEIKEVNQTGVFSDLAAGSYRLKIRAANGCEHNDEFKVTQPDSLTVEIEDPSAEDRPKCPSDSYRLVKLKLNGLRESDAVARTRWVYLATPTALPDTLVTRDPELEGAKPGKYTVTVNTKLGCTAIADSKELPGPEPHKLTPPVVPNVKCSYKELRGDEEVISYAPYTITSISGGTNLSCKWELHPLSGFVPRDGGLTQDGDPVEIGKEYRLVAGEHYVVIRNGECEDRVPVSVGVDGGPMLNGIMLDAAYRNRICYNDPRPPEVYVVADATRSADDSVRWTFLYTLPDKPDDPQPGGFTDRLDAKVRLDRPVIGKTRVIAEARSTDNCLDHKELEIEPTWPSMNLRIDELNSRVSTLRNLREKVIQPPSVVSHGLGKYDRVKLGSSEPDEHGYKYPRLHDSVALGVLAEVPNPISFRVDSEEVPELNFKPESLFVSANNPVDPFAYILTMPRTVTSKGPSYEGVEIREVRHANSGRTHRFLRSVVTVKNSTTGCAENLVLWIRLVNTLRIPNVFTPNGDGINDRWLNNGDEKYRTLFSHLDDLLPNMEVEVFTRGGTRVWGAKGQAISKGWDGDSDLDGPLPIGTYYYVIRFNVKDSGSSWGPIAGSVTIVR